MFFLYCVGFLLVLRSPSTTQDIGSSRPFLNIEIVLSHFGKFNHEGVTPDQRHVVELTDVSKLHLVYDSL